MENNFLKIISGQNEEIIDKLEELKEAVNNIFIPPVPDEIKVKNIDLLSNKLDELILNIKDKKELDENSLSLIKKNLSEIYSILNTSKILEVLNEIKNKKDVNIDFNILNKFYEELQDIYSLILKIYSGKTSINLSGIEETLKNINSKILIKDYEKKLEDIEKAIKNIKLNSNYYVSSLVGIKNFSDTRINPATEETLQNINNKLNQSYEELLFIKTYTADIQNKVQELFILDKYVLSDIDDSLSVKYYGYVGLNGIWYILQEDTINKTYRYARGDSDYETNWTNRSSLTYDYFYNVF